MWGKQNVSGPHWPLCTLWSKETADRRLLRAFALGEQRTEGWKWGKASARPLKVSQGGLPGARGYLSQSQRLSISSRCWFHKKTALYTTVHGYFLVTFLFSAVVLGLVAWKIFTLSSATAGKQQRQNCKGVLTLLGLSSLVGMTWGLAILTPLGLSTIYVFALFNSLQGEAPGPGAPLVSAGGRRQVGGEGSGLQEAGFHSGQLPSRAPILNSQASPKNPRAGKLAELMGTGGRLSTRHPNQSGCVLYLFPWSHVPRLPFGLWCLSAGPCPSTASEWLPIRPPQPYMTFQVQ